MLFRRDTTSAYAGSMSQRNEHENAPGDAGRGARSQARTTGADGVSVLPAVMAAGLVAGAIAITRSLRKSRAQRTAAGRHRADRVSTDSSTHPSTNAVPSGQVAVAATVDDDGR